MKASEGLGESRRWVPLSAVESAHDPSQFSRTCSGPSHDQLLPVCCLRLRGGGQDKLYLDDCRAARSDMKRCGGGGIIMSSVVTMYQLAFFFHTGSALRSSATRDWIGRPGTARPISAFEEEESRSLTT
jgi:hypothetical protein